MNERVSFGKLIKSLRIHKGLYLREAAALASVTIDYLHKMEKNNIRHPHHDIMDRLAKAYEVESHILYASLPICTKCKRIILARQKCKKEYEAKQQENKTESDGSTNGPLN